jgi:hypothetical protein
VQQAGARRNLHQADFGAGQFLLGLRVVAAVGPDAGKVPGGDEGADRAGEARHPFAAAPTAGQVFGQVGIGGGDDEGVDMVARHRRAQLGKAFGANVLGRGGGHGWACRIVFQARMIRRNAALWRERALRYDIKWEHDTVFSVGGKIFA